MYLIRSSIERPVAAIVGVLLVLLFGLIGLARLPYQLSPSVIEPEVTVTTTWSGATPYEVEREIIEPQENTLKGIPGLMEMESDANNGRGSISLLFRVGTDVDNALLRVSNKINEVRRYPEGVEKPAITATGATTAPAIWMALKTVNGNPRHIDTYLTYFENDVRQHLERVPGVADLFTGGGTLEEMQIIVGPERLAAFGLTIADLTRALDSENINVSAGIIGVGRRDYRVRTTGQFTDERDLMGLVLKSTGQRRVRLGDVAEVRRGYAKRTAVALQNGEPAMMIGIRPEPGVNVLELTDRVEAVVKSLNDGPLAERGIYFKWFHDQRWYIESAIGLIKSDIFIGGMLAVAVLMLFLRDVRATIVVAISIPISVIGTFMVLDMTGRNLNVVSLAGIAFAVGMLVDNAIVVIENIDRHKKMGKSGFDASYEGTVEVWGAVLASTLTHVSVFLPVVFIAQEAGQLFKDIAIAISASIMFSLAVSVTVTPMLTYQLYRHTRGMGKVGFGAGIGRFGSRLSNYYMSLVERVIATPRSRILTVGCLTMAAIAIAMFLVPKREYLPQGNRNFVQNLFVPPPGLSVNERMEIGETVSRMTAPYIGKDQYEGLPGIESVFFMGRDTTMLAAAISTQPEHAADILPLFREIITSIPGMSGVSSQPGVLQTRFGRGRTIDLDISGGHDLDSLVKAAAAAMGKLKEVMPDVQVRPVPSIEVLYPEARIIPDRDMLKANGMSTSELGTALDVMLDGKDVGDFREEGRKKIDLVLKTAGSGAGTPEELYSSLVVTPGGKSVPVSSLSKLEHTQGIGQIRHLERNRAFTLQVTPPANVPLEETMERIESEVIGPLRAEGVLSGMEARLSGTADKLRQTGDVLKWNFILAALLTYLLMSALFGNFIYPLIIMFTVPLAAAGGVGGLWLMNFFVNQPMDILTMLGFIFLIGVVVTNAILIVHQTLNNIRNYAMQGREAVLEATRSRLRPIFMSSATTILGLLPLVVAPGAGSELYRGLGCVLLGGLAASTVFTILVIPSLLMFVIGMETSNNKEKSI